MGYNEICLEVQDPAWKEVWDKESATPLYVNGDRVISFDNPRSYKEKIKFAMEKKLGGVMYYSLEKDDFRGDCDSSKVYPVLTTINYKLNEFFGMVYNDLIPQFEKHNAHYFWNDMKNNTI